MSSYTKTFIFGIPYCSIVFGSFLEKYTLNKKTRSTFILDFSIFMLYCICLIYYFIFLFFIRSKLPLVQNKIAATALGSGSRDMALVCIERPSITLHHQMQKWAPQWIILPFTSWTFQKDIIKTCGLFKLKIHSSIWSFMFHDFRWKYFAFHFCRQLNVSRNPFINNLYFFNLYQLDLQLSRCLSTLPTKSSQVMPDAAPGGQLAPPPLPSLPWPGPCRALLPMFRVPHPARRQGRGHGTLPRWGWKK